jgi:4-hydroxymandelate oxidase
MPGHLQMQSRRKLLKFLLNSPLLIPGVGMTGLASGSLLAQVAADRGYIPPSPERAANVFDMENLARQKLNEAHWTYIAQGVDDEQTLRANREGYQRLHLKARRLVDVSRIDRSTTLFGTAMPSPILLAPIGGMGMAHLRGETEAATGARDTGHQMVVSIAATFGLEDIVEARGDAVWFQIFPMDVWEVTRGLLRRAERAGSTVLFLTVDVPARNQDRMRRFDRSSASCRGCHKPGGSFAQKAMMQGLNLPPDANVNNPALDWNFVDRLRDATEMQLVVKGITLPEDAERAVEHGMDGIVVSNHGGRAEESGYATIDSLPEVVAAVAGRVPVLVDGGIRRGTDVLKALALGADAVLVGRPYVWGLASFGAAGVAQVMRILDRELDIAMRQAGTPSLADIDAGLIRRT